MRNGRNRIELPKNDSTWFDSFFQILQQAEQDSSVIHIIHYGDSQLEGDRISSNIREYLQSEFGGAGPGMLPPVVYLPSITTNLSNSGNLLRYILYGPQKREANHNHYGPLAQLAKLNGSAVISFSCKGKIQKSFPHVGGYRTIKLLASKKGNLNLKLVYDKTESSEETDSSTTAKKRPNIRIKKVEADSPSVEEYNKLCVYTWKLPDSTSGAKIHLNGNKDIYAVSADGAYGAAVDNVPMRGSAGTVFHKMDIDLLSEAYKAMNVRLIIMEYGGNLVPSANKGNTGWIRKLINREIQIVKKANPDAKIIFFGPADMSKLIDDKWETYPGLVPTIKTLRDVALSNGLAFWDMHRVMGGSGSINKWVPSLGSADHIHFTRRGAAYMGEQFSSSLKMYYNYYMLRKRHENDKSGQIEVQNSKDSLKTKDSSKTNDSPKKTSLKTGSLKINPLKIAQFKVNLVYTNTYQKVTGTNL